MTNSKKLIKQVILGKGDLENEIKKLFSTNCSTVPSEIILHNENGLLFELNNPEELAISMGRICFDANFYKCVFKNSHKNIAKFDEKMRIGKYKKIFEN